MSLAIKIMECFDTEIGEALCSGCSRWMPLGMPLAPPLGMPLAPPLGMPLGMPLGLPNWQ